MSNLFIMCLTSFLDYVADIITIVDAYQQIKKKSSYSGEQHKKNILLFGLVIVLFCSALYLIHETEDNNVIFPVIEILKSYSGFSMFDMLKSSVIILFLAVCMFKLFNFFYFRIKKFPDDTWKEHITCGTLKKETKDIGRKYCKNDDQRSKSL